jgi:hypothetical protein
MDEIERLARAYHETADELEQAAIVLLLAAEIRERSLPSPLSVTEQIVAVLDRAP